MTNNRSTAALEQIRIQTAHLQPEYVLPHPFEVVDAGVWEYFRQEQQRHSEAPQVKRQRTTTGSGHYTFTTRQGDQAIDLADISLRAVARDRTYVAIHPRQRSPMPSLDVQEYVERFCLYHLFLFLAWFWTDQHHMAELASKSPTPDNTIIPADGDGTPRFDLGVRPAGSGPLNTEAAENQTSGTIPPIPDLTTAGYEAVFEWERKYGRAYNIQTNAELGKLIHRSEGTVANMRSQLGKQKRPSRRKP